MFGSFIPSKGNKTLWMGDIDATWTEQTVTSLFPEGMIKKARVMTDRLTGQSLGYAFVEFLNNKCAERALEELNGQPMGRSGRHYRLNWAAFGVDEPRPNDHVEYPLFVGDLALTVTDYQLLKVFQSRYGSCTSAKVVTDAVTGVARGFGFVRFTDQSEQQRVLSEMQGTVLNGRAIRLRPAEPKPRPKMSGGVSRMGFANDHAHLPVGRAGPGAGRSINEWELDPNNTTLFVGGLGSDVDENVLRSAFAPFGTIVYLKVPLGKSCGFVEFSGREAAERALNAMAGALVGSSRVRLAWGKPAPVRFEQPITPPNEQASSESSTSPCLTPCNGFSGATAAATAAAAAAFLSLYASANGSMAAAEATEVAAKALGMSTTVTNAVKETVRERSGHIWRPLEKSDDLEAEDLLSKCWSTPPLLELGGM